MIKSCLFNGRQKANNCFPFCLFWGELNVWDESFFLFILFFFVSYSLKILYAFYARGDWYVLACPFVFMFELEKKICDSNLFCFSCFLRILNLKIRFLIWICLSVVCYLICFYVVVKLVNLWYLKKSTFTFIYCYYKLNR